MIAFGASGGRFAKRPYCRVPIIYELNIAEEPKTGFSYGKITAKN